MIHLGRRYYYKRLSERELNEKYVNKNKLLRRFMDGHPHRNEEKVGYCWNNQHKGYLTEELMKRHQCMEKDCHFCQLYKQKQVEKGSKTTVGGE